MVYCCAGYGACYSYDASDGVVSVVVASGVYGWVLVEWPRGGAVCGTDLGPWPMWRWVVWVGR